MHATAKPGVLALDILTVRFNYQYDIYTSIIYIHTAGRPTGLTFQTTPPKKRQADASILVTGGADKDAVVYNRKVGGWTPTFRYMHVYIYIYIRLWSDLMCTYVSCMTSFIHGCVYLSCVCSLRSKDGVVYDRKVGGRVFTHLYILLLEGPITSPPHPTTPTHTPNPHNPPPHTLYIHIPQPKIKNNHTKFPIPSLSPLKKEY